jgi:hypothetical protein
MAGMVIDRHQANVRYPPAADPLGVNEMVCKTVPLGGQRTLAIGQQTRLGKVELIEDGPRTGTWPVDRSVA